MCLIFFSFQDRQLCSFSVLSTGLRSRSEGQDKKSCASRLGAWTCCPLPSVLILLSGGRRVVSLPSLQKTLLSDFLNKPEFFVLLHKCAYTCTSLFQGSEDPPMNKLLLHGLLTSSHNPIRFGFLDNSAPDFDCPKFKLVAVLFLCIPRSIVLY